MRLTVNDLVAVKSTGMLPVVGWLLLGAFVVGVALGGGTVWRWHKGQAAIAEAAQLRQDVKAWGEVAADLRQQSTEQIGAMRDAAQRLGSISNNREQDREETRQWSVAQRAALDELRRLRADWVGLQLGPDFVRHWNAANRGAITPAAAPSGDPAEPPATVPGAADPDQERSGSHPGAARPGSGAVQGLQGRKGAAGPGGQRMGGDSVAVVLPGSQADGYTGGRLPE